jgi:hypothetical protein
MNDKHPENSLHRLLMDAYSGWKATQPRGPPGALTEVVGFIREMIRQIDPSTRPSGWKQSPSRLQRFPTP